jgi:hypothetical protein
VATPAHVIELPNPADAAEQQVVRYESQATDIGARADALVIKSEADYQAGLALVAEMKALFKAIEDDRKSITDPINQSLKRINARYKGPKDYLEAHFRPLERRCGTFYAEQQRKAREAEAKALAAQQAKQEKANARAEELGVAPAMVAPVAPRVAAPAKTTQFSDGSSVGMRAVKKWRVTDEGQIPREFWMLDEKKLNGAARAGITVPGIEIYEEYTTSARAGA